MRPSVKHTLCRNPHLWPHLLSCGLFFFLLCVSVIIFCDVCAVPGGKGGTGAEMLHTTKGLRDVSQTHRHHHNPAGGGGEGERPGEAGSFSHTHTHTADKQTHSVRGLISHASNRHFGAETTHSTSSPRVSLTKTNTVSRSENWRRRVTSFTSRLYAKRPS